MNDFKIGDKVKIKGKNESIGYVSHINKGHLFELADHLVDVHLGEGKHMIYYKSELEIYEHE